MISRRRHHRLIIFPWHLDNTLHQHPCPKEHNTRRYRSKSLLSYNQQAAKGSWIRNEGLTSSIPNLKLNFLAIHINRPYFKINAYGRDKTRRKLVLAESK